MFTGLPATKHAVGEAIRDEATESAGDGYEKVRCIASDIMQLDGAVERALILALTQTKGAPSTPAGGHFDRHAPTLRARLLELVQAADASRICGVSLGELLHGVQDVRFSPLPDEDKARINDGILFVDDVYLRAQLDSPHMDDVMLARCVVYIIHELIHLGQGIGKKATVTQLRNTGAEVILFHLDLGADHAASCIAHSVFPEWAVDWLKDLQSRALADFPAGSSHSPAARARKAARVVAIRADVLARRFHALNVADDRGHIFVEHAYGGGDGLLVQHGPLMRVLHVAHLTPQEARTLEAAADPAWAQPNQTMARPADFVAEIDAILSAWLRRSGAS